MRLPRKVVRILHGLQGSGKTTFARQIKQFLENRGLVVRIHSTDDFFTDDRGHYVYDRSKLSEYHKHNFEAFCESVENPSVDVIFVDNTNIEPWNWQQYQKFAEEHGAIVNHKYMIADIKTCFRYNIHGVPFCKLVHLYQRYPRRP